MNVAWMASGNGACTEGDAVTEIQPFCDDSDSSRTSSSATFDDLDQPVYIWSCPIFLQVAHDSACSSRLVGFGNLPWGGGRSLQGSLAVPSETCRGNIPHSLK